MRMSNDNRKIQNEIKVQIKKIKGNSLDCRHITSGFQVHAFAKDVSELELGQVVLLEYQMDNNGGSYVLKDRLMEEISAKVLEAQHIISDGTMYTSIILENPVNKQRVHSLVPSTTKLFNSTNIIISGDTVKLKINNGNLFSIKH